MKLLSIDRVCELVGGSPNDLILALLKSGQPAPEYDTIRKWIKRGVIPSYWVGAVIWACACHGIDPLKLIVDQQ